MKTKNRKSKPATSAKGRGSAELRSKELLDALVKLTDAIGCYGPRIKEEVSIHWGNGVILRINGKFESGGLSRIVDWIQASNVELSRAGDNPKR